MPRKPRPSRLSIQSRLNQLQRENEEFREALETIADILEDVGILDSSESEDEDPEPRIIQQYGAGIPEQADDPSNLIEDKD